jgi:hypothetical protein
MVHDSQQSNVLVAGQVGGAVCPRTLTSHDATLHLMPQAETQFALLSGRTGDSHELFNAEARY